jgi:hypothetical protein
LKRLADEIALFLSEEAITAADLDGLFIRLNFNHPKFIGYQTEKWLDELKNKDTVNEKILCLRLYLKELRQLTALPNWYYLKDVVSAKEQLINWIQEEIEFLVNKQAFFKETVLEEQKMESTKKMHTSLSVSQLACFIRLLVENKTITNVNQTEIIKFFALHFSTKKSAHISSIHLRSEYYQTDVTAVESIKGLLLDLVNLSRKLK